jgi:hypothetical protein
LKKEILVVTDDYCHAQRKSRTYGWHPAVRDAVAVVPMAFADVDADGHYLGGAKHSGVLQDVRAGVARGWTDERIVEYVEARQKNRPRAERHNVQDAIENWRRAKRRDGTLTIAAPEYEAIPLASVRSNHLQQTSRRDPDAPIPDTTEFLAEFDIAALWQANQDWGVEEARENPDHTTSSELPWESFTSVTLPQVPVRSGFEVQRTERQSYRPFDRWAFFKTAERLVKVKYPEARCEVGDDYYAIRFRAIDDPGDRERNGIMKLSCHRRGEAIIASLYVTSLANQDIAEALVTEVQGGLRRAVISREVETSWGSCMITLHLHDPQAVA